MHVLSCSCSFLYVPVLHSQLAPFPNCSSPSFFLQSDRVKKRRKARRWWKEMLPAVSGGNGAMKSNYLDESTFLASLMPKKEINADKFIEAHPEYDGRGVIIAIFDSGVDPAAAGLQLTSDGKPKILDVLDCTGSGDIDTSKIVKADADGCIIGASGAKLILNPSWKNPSGDWHVGYKLAYELFTEELKKRLKVERRKKWDEKNQKAISEALKHLHEFDQKHKKVDDVELKRIREDFENRVDLLRKHSETYDDKGPVIDAVVWCDGDTWRVALDTQSFEEEEDAGKLASFQPMTNYRIERGYGVFSKLDACSFVTNVYEEGNVLSLVTDSSPHGTHVAGITSAYHPKEPLLNGIAPGAQLISCKIGDSRLGSMETGTGLTRAVIAAVEHKCDLINMSYGEPTMLPDYGRFVDLVNEAVDKYRLIYVSSAGNSGPALSTVGAPGGTSSSIIGVGAYVSPSMSAAAHAVIEPLQEGIEYTWSSRGPTADGNLGVSISAPGCAVAPVPTWTLQKRMLMNGTSMASPSACGGVALLISAMKAENIPVSPYSVRTSIENTALPLGSRAEEKLTTGHGLLQVDRAYDYIQQAKSLPSVSYTVKVNRAGKSNASRRGIYLREGASSQYSTEWSVQIEPKFHEDASKLDQLVPFEECIQLHSSDPSVVKAPEYLLLTNNGRSFNVIVDPSRLAEALHYYEVYGTDCKSPWRGTLFQVPITIVKPLSIQQKPSVVSFTGLSFSPGCIERKFIEVPENATWGEATMRTSGFDTTRRFFIDIVQLCPKKRPIKWERVVTHPTPTLQNFSFPIEGGFTMELAIAQFWSSGIGSNEATIVDFQIEFHGVSVTKEVLFDGGDSAARISARASLSSERLIPTAVLKQVRTPLRPSECDLKPLSVKRDSLPSGKQIMALTLTYKFKLEESSEVTPKVPLLNDRVYDSLFESQFYMISDSNKRIYGMGDIYPKAVKLPKGEYSLQLHVRHENIQHLERMKEMVLFIDRSLAEKEFVRLSFSSLPDGHLTGDGSFKSLTLLPGETEAFYMAPPSKDNLPKTCLAGSILHGDVTYGVLSFGAKKDDNSPGSCPVHYPISFVIPPNKDGKDKGKAASENLKSVSELLNEEIRDAKLKVLSSIKRGTEEEVTKWRELANSLKVEYPKYTPLLHMILEGLLTRGSDCYTVAENKEIISAADEVIESIDKDELAKYFSERIEPEDDKAEELKKKMETTRDQLAEALYRKGLAIAENDSLQVQEQQVTPDQEQASEKAKRFEENFKELKRWVDVKSPKYALISVLNERRCQRLGTALKFLCSLIQEDANPPKKKHYELKLSLLDELGWIHVAEYERRWMHVRFPPSLPLF